MTARPAAKAYVFVLLVMLAGLWPLLAFGQPSYIADSSSYYRGGEAAWERVTDLLPRDTLQGQAAGGSVTSQADPAQQAVGVRSLAYSAFAFILSAPGASLLLLVMAQTFVAAVLLWLFLRVTRVMNWHHVLGIPAILGVASSFPVFGTLATPDLWAGSMILCLALLGLFWERLSRPERLFVGLILAFAVASHASHILLAVCALAIIALAAIARRMFRNPLLGVGILGAPALALSAGLAISFLSGLVAFGEASAVPKRYPYALARAIEDGPAKWYLEENCPKLRYAVCELFPEEIPGGVGDFLWDDGGIAQRATPEQMERIRAEEPEILRQAVAAYPWYQMQASTRNVLRQLTYIAIPPAIYQNHYLDARGYLQRRAEQPPPLQWHEFMQGFTVVFSLLVLLATFAKAPPLMRYAVVVILIFIVLNILICAILSAPDPRYLSRTLWLLPVTAALMFAQTRSVKR